MTFTPGLVTYGEREGGQEPQFSWQVKEITKTRLDMWGSTQKIVTIFMGRLPLEQYHSRFLQRVFSMDWTILIFFLGCSRFITLQVEHWIVVAVAVAL